MAATARLIDAGVRADEAVVGLGDQDRTDLANDALRLAQHELGDRRILVPLPSTTASANGDGSIDASSTVRPSALLTILLVTTRTSPLSSGVSAVGRGVGARAPASRVPASISGRPARPKICSACHGCESCRPAPKTSRRSSIVAEIWPGTNMAPWFPTSSIQRRGARCRASRSPTSRTTAPVAHGTVRVAFNRPEVRNAFRPHTVDELYTALDHARMSTDVGCVLLTGNGPSAEGRRVGVLQRRRPTHPRPRRLQVRGGRRRRNGRRDAAASSRARRTAAHPRGAAADPVHAQGRRSASCPGGRPAAGTACTSSAISPSPAASTPASSRPTPMSPASTVASARPTSPARSGRSSPARSSSSATSTPPRTRTGWGWSTRSSPHADLEATALEWGARDQRQEPHRAADAEVLVQPDRRRSRRPAGLRRRGNASRVHDRRGAGGRDAFLEKRDPDWSRTPGCSEVC